jgi:hypothetical protein
MKQQVRATILGQGTTPHPPVVPIRPARYTLR